MANQNQKTNLQVVMLGDSLTHNGGIATVEHLILKHMLPTVTIHHIATHQSGSVAYRLRLFSGGLIKFIGRLLTHQVDLVHIHIADWGSVPRKVLIAIVALLFRKPIVMHTHGAEFHLTYKALPELGRSFLSRLFQRCRWFITLSKSWQNFYIHELELAETQVVVLPNPIELPEQVPNRSQNSNLTLLFMGKIGQRKGTFDLIQSFAQLPSTDRQIQLWLAGDGEIEHAKALVAQLNLGERVQFLGWIDAEQRNQLLAESDIFVLPSHNEALPMALLEAMAWGLPVVSCPVGGIADFVCSGQNGLLVTPGEPKQLSAALQSLIANERLRITLGQAARQTVASLDVQHYVLRLEQIYHACVRN